MTARQEPRTITTKSDMADKNDEPPKDLPTIAVAIGTRWRREAKAGNNSPDSEIPSEPMMSGMRAPPVSPKCTTGMPIAIARS